MKHAIKHRRIFTTKSDNYKRDKCKAGNNYKESEKKLPTAVSFGDRFERIGKRGEFEKGHDKWLSFLTHLMYFNQSQRDDKNWKDPEPQPPSSALDIAAAWKCTVTLS